MKNPLKLAGIEPATFRFVAQHLNHCATAVPVRTNVLKYFTEFSVTSTWNCSQASRVNFCSINNYPFFYPKQIIYYLFCFILLFYNYVTFTLFLCSLPFFPLVFNVQSYVFFFFFSPPSVHFPAAWQFSATCLCINNSKPPIRSCSSPESFLLTLLSVALLFLMSACKANPLSDIYPDPFSLNLSVSTIPTSHLMASHKTCCTPTVQF